MSTEKPDLGEDKLDARLARRRHADAQDYLAHLLQARRAKQRLDTECAELDALIAVARASLQRWSNLADARIDQRRSWSIPPTAAGHQRPQFLFFLDECGTPAPGDLAFPVFCLTGVAVDEAVYPILEARWVGWKAEWLNNPDARLHEPDVRHRNGPFRSLTEHRREAAVAALDKLIDDLDFTCFAAVIDKRAYREQFPDERVDDHLPASAYLMCVDFVFERFVHFLHFAGRDGRGLTIADSRGGREDALVHAEFIRLHLEGSQYQPERQFRYHLRPYIEFHAKERRTCGVELADLCARPIAEKVIDRAADPSRWTAVQRRFYDGTQQRKSSYGLKVFPSLPRGSIFSEEA